MTNPRFDKSKLPSRHVTEGPARAPHRSYFYAMGITEEEIHQPWVGVATCWNEAAPCNIALNRQAQTVKTGVKTGGGTPREFTTITVTDGIAMGHEGMRSSLASRDPQLGEAATNLGASPFRVFRTITLPLSLPGVLTGCVFVFVPAMSNFVIPELLGGGKTVLIGNLIRDQFLKARDWPFGAALALVLTAFLVILLVLQSRASRRLTEGRPLKAGPRNA